MVWEDGGSNLASYPMCGHSNWMTMRDYLRRQCGLDDALSVLALALDDCPELIVSTAGLAYALPL